MNTTIFTLILIVIIIIVIIALVVCGLSIVRDPQVSYIIKIKRRVRLSKIKTPWTKFNPSIEKVKDLDIKIEGKNYHLKDNYIVAYRLVDGDTFSPRKSKIGISIMDNNFKIVKELIFDEVPKAAWIIRGLEDPRIFLKDGKVFCLAVLPTTLPEHLFIPTPRQHLVELDLNTKKLKHNEIETLYEERTENQKNWNAFVYKGEHLFVTRVQPHIVVRINYEKNTAEKLYETSNPILKAYKDKGVNIHGGTRGILINQHYIAICHTKRWKYNSVFYKNLFYEYESVPPFRITRVSREFNFPSAVLRPQLSAPIEMTTGIAEHDENSLIVCTGIEDEDMYGFIVDKKVVFDLLDGKDPNKEL